KVPVVIREKVASLAQDPVPDVKLQVAIAARKIDGLDPMPLLIQVLTTCGDDKLISPIVWQNLHPLLEDHDQFLKIVAKTDLKQSPNLAALMPRVLDRLLGRRASGREPDVAPVVSLLKMLLESKNADAGAARPCLAALAGKLQTGE